MAYRWRIVAVEAGEAQEIGTGQYEPFAVVEQDGQDLVLCKAFLEDLDDKASERESYGNRSG